MAGRVYDWRMKTWKQALLGSPLLWIGAAGALGTFLTYWLLWSGHLNFLAKLADALHAGLLIGPLFVFIFIISVGMFIIGAMIGIVRLMLKLTEKPPKDDARHHEG
jgi:hypothetical protein